jgi:hypothetical protein
MRITTRAFHSFVTALSLIATTHAATPTPDALDAALAAVTKGQQMLKLSVRVVDPTGKPVTKAKVSPWALRSSQGHGSWDKNDLRANMDPAAVITDENGAATVLYPLYRHVEEQIRTIGVSLFVDHPEFAYVNDLHIDVPLESDAPYEIKLAAGSPVELRPTIDGQPADLNDLFAIWSDGRSWQPEASPEKTPDGSLRIPAMPPGKNSVMLVRLDGDRATHFSKIIDFELTPGEPKKIDVPLRPSLRIEGKLSDNVPRPVKNGRLKLNTLKPEPENYDRVSWFSWTPVEPDGTFTIDGWPADERLQIIGLCDGYIATSGAAPDVVKDPPDPKTDFFKRPQVFDANPDTPIEIAMTPLVRCVATAVDDDNTPIAGVDVRSGPNVQWWNDGSQIYCRSLVRGEKLLRTRDYDDAVDDTVSAPFRSTTDAQGEAILELPAGAQKLSVKSDVYELPAFLGRRDVEVVLVGGSTSESLLRLQPRGTEKLGEWDKLAGVVFGCSTREGRRICALPGVTAKMNEFTRRFREAKDQRDPQLLSEAYAAVADAFTNVGDQTEATKWRQKAAEQAAKAEKATPSDRSEDAPQ